MWKISIKKEPKEAMIAVIFLLPFMEISIARKLFLVSVGSAFLPASATMSLLVAVLLRIIVKISKTNHISTSEKSTIIKIEYYANILFAGVFVFSTFISVLNGNFLTSTFQFLWFFSSVFLAISFVRAILDLELNSVSIAKYAMFYFWLYLLFVTLYNIAQYGYTIGDRLASTGGGSVIFGYTIALFESFGLVMRDHIKARNLNIFMVSCIICAFLTGSRGSVWPAIIIFIIFIFSIKKEQYKILLRGEL